MPSVDIAKFEAMPAADLHNRRLQLMEKNKAIPPIDWELDDLNEMAAIIGVLRRKASGPPKAKEAKAGGKKKPVKAELGDLL